ncbi:MAG: HlyD family efflux transporter periplasmic adaptor subunit [Hydrogenophaga sp.]|uniref:efflux RND transporter periplasmic adaptor subunit n=1 Tax=Hydrogenophaga sp. TaxID=1904254 RepID=UPI001D4FE427|nr:HlyD family efflux transporter periplasmic adaptor subunit [Hydrogenophaga sp.]MBX3610551.1 HlyD family efflux transporter periplasmic adaptor subunit [Hydrogenophaga sp.]
MKLQRRWIYGGIAALAVVAALAWALRPAPLPVQTALATRGPFEQAIEEDGVLRLVQRYTVASPTAGELQRPGLRVGDTVSAGEAVVVLRPAAPGLIDARTRAVLQQRLGSAQAALAAADAQVARQQAALAQAQLDVKRQEELARAQFVSAAAREQAELNRRQAQQAVAAAQAERRVADFALHEAQAALSLADGNRSDNSLWTLRSPVAGRVIALHKESEGTVAAGQPLLDIGDTERMEAVVDLLSGDAARVPEGAAVTLQIGTGLPSLRAHVARVEPVAFTKVSALGIEEQRVNLRIALDEPWPQRRAPGDGYRVDARIVTLALPDVLRVPTAALVRAGEQWQVYLVNADERVQVQAVTPGSRGDEFTVIEQGLQAGARVVLYPGNGVRAGQRVVER